LFRVSFLEIHVLSHNPIYQHKHNRGAKFLTLIRAKQNS
jgi:hypothetical protein